MAQEGAHEEGPGKAGAQRAPRHLFRRADTRRGTQAEGERQTTEEIVEESGTTAEEAGRERCQRRSGNPEKRVGNAAGQR